MSRQMLSPLFLNQADLQVALFLPFDRGTTPIGFLSESTDSTLTHRKEEPHMAEEYDGIIIGAGPNGLTVAAYLAKAGLKILVLEKNFEAGGGLATEQVTLPGFLHNTRGFMPW
jgi:alkyl hydroperoxide reductase subunit AhpF